MNPGQLNGITGSQFFEHVRCRVHLLIQIQHHPGGDGDAEVAGKAGQYLGHQHRIGVINAEVEYRLMRAPLQLALPFTKGPPPLLQAFAGDQLGHQWHQMLCQTH